jgi:hypothetical protein
MVAPATASPLDAATALLAVLDRLDIEVGADARAALVQWRRRLELELANALTA